MRRIRHMLFGSGDTIAGAIYGTIVVLATIVAGGANDGVGDWQLAAAVVVTNVVLGLAHLYAELVAGGIALKRRLTPQERSVVWRREVAIPVAAILPVTVLVLGAADVLDETTAVWIAIGLGVATLGFQGLRYARVEQMHWIGTTISVAINLSLGLVMVALKVLISH
jgi:hypothetical protein